MTKTPQDFYRECMLILIPYFDQHGFQIIIEEREIDKSKTIDLDAIFGKAEKKKDDWSQSIFFDPVWSPWDVRIDPIFSFRHQLIQSILGKFNDYAKNEFAATISLRSFYLIDFHNRPDLEFEQLIEDELSLVDYVKNFKRFMDELAWPIMNSLHSLNEFDVYLNHPAQRHKSHFLRVASPGLIAARLNQNQNYETLYLKYLHIAQEFNNTQLEKELKELKTYLDTHSLQDLLKN